MNIPRGLPPIFLTLVCTCSMLIAGQRPNIMVFLVDDMGMMDTSVPFLTDEQGNAQVYPLNEYYRTPAMERLAKQGTRFNQFYAMSVCSPTRVSIMTGQNAARHRVTNWINPRSNNAGKFGAPQWNWAGLRSSDITLPGILRNAGYQTIHVGKGHFAPEDHEGANPANLGFQKNIAGASFGAPGSYYGTKNYGHGTKRSHHAVPGLEKYHGTETFLTEALTIEAKRAISDTVEQNKPFYLYFAHYAVHARLIRTTGSRQIIPTLETGQRASFRHADRRNGPVAWSDARPL
ncbi:MAG: sulfatase-like hydrolase/transferase [Pirellulaceae bacterium]